MPDREAGAELRAGRHEARSVLATRIDPELQAMVDLAREVTDMGVASISILDDDRFHFMVTSGATPFVAPYDQAVCQHAMQARGVFEVADLLEDPRTRELPYVDGDAVSLRYYASAPVWVGDGLMIGRLCLFDTVPRRLDPARTRVLLRLASLAGAHIRDEVAARHRRGQRAGAWAPSPR